MQITPVQKIFFLLLLLTSFFILFGCILDEIGTDSNNDPLNWGSGLGGGGGSTPDGSGDELGDGADNSSPPDNSNPADGSPDSTDGSRTGDGSSDNGFNDGGAYPDYGGEDYCASIAQGPYTKEFRTMLQEQLDKPKLCKATLVSIASYAQMTCLTDIVDIAMERARAQLAYDVSNPPSCTRYVLELGQIAQQMPKGEPTFAQALIETEKNLEHTLGTPGLCTEDYLEIATLADALGFPTTSAAAKAAAVKSNQEHIDALTKDGLHAIDVACKTANEVEACSRMAFDQTQHSSHINETITINFSGYLKDRTYYSYMDMGMASSYTFEGEVIWTFASTEEQECLTITRTGSGKVTSKDNPLGYFGVNEEGNYSGDISAFDANVLVVEKKKSVVNADGEDMCKDTEGDIRTDQMPLGFGFEGKTNTADRIHGDSINGQYTSPPENSENSTGTNSTTISWMLETPPC